MDRKKSLFDNKEEESADFKWIYGLRRLDRLRRSLEVVFILGPICVILQSLPANSAKKKAQNLRFLIRYLITLIRAHPFIRFISALKKIYNPYLSIIYTSAAILIAPNSSSRLFTASNTSLRA